MEKYNHIINDSKILSKNPEEIVKLEIELLNSFYLNFKNFNHNEIISLIKTLFYIKSSHLNEILLIAKQKKISSFKISSINSKLGQEYLKINYNENIENIENIDWKKNICIHNNNHNIDDITDEELNNFVEIKGYCFNKTTIMKLNKKIHPFTKEIIDPFTLKRVEYI